MAASLFAVNKGYLDDITVKQVLPFEAGLHSYLKTKHAALLSKIEESKQLDKDSEATLSAAIADFKKSGAF
jgi:F-type H+-transporting ATPase subunit alpha